MYHFADTGIKDKKNIGARKMPCTRKRKERKNEMELEKLKFRKKKKKVDLHIVINMKNKEIKK